MTGGGSLLPMSEVIRQAAAAHHYLVVFDDHTECRCIWGGAAGWHPPRSGSCCMPAIAVAPPGCTAPAYHSEAHHDDGWAAARSPTDIDRQSLACGPDNRRIEETAAGGPENAETVAPNGSRRRSWIPAKPA